MEMCKSRCNWWYQKLSAAWLRERRETLVKFSNVIQLSTALRKLWFFKWIRLGWSCYGDAEVMTTTMLLRAFLKEFLRLSMRQLPRHWLDLALRQPTILWPWLQQGIVFSWSRATVWGWWPFTVWLGLCFCMLGSEASYRHMFGQGNWVLDSACWAGEKKTFHNIWYNYSC